MSIIFFDFDGTITRRDTTDAVLEAFADPGWQDVEDEWVAGRIGSRECMRRQLGMVRATEAQLNELLDNLEIDDHFASLLEDCASRQIAAHIISDGFDYFIRRVLLRRSLGLKRALAKMTISSSHLEFQDGRIVTGFPFYAKECEHGCATCKPAVMQALNQGSAKRPTIFVGDGLSDRFAAAAADVVFAKHKLLVHCQSEGIPCYAYESFEDLRSWLREGEETQTAGLLEPLPA